MSSKGADGYKKGEINMEKQNAHDVINKAMKDIENRVKILRLFMTFASFSTVIGVFENIVGTMIDTFKMRRIKAVVINCVLLLIASMPCVLGYNVLSNVRLAGRDILDTEDFLVSNLILPIGSLIFLAFCVTKYGWGVDKFFEEVNTGKGIKLKKGLVFYFKYILPLLILVILISGLL